ncbi:hypothetical protein BMI91_19605 [Thioclava sediminum]|uniref:Uncharacterized protein n=1 Tax=Thioclava sediminum TaxID=1915319 RepID=A0ABX3MVJ5_9RHOB|nr:hypothetical protein [Thioclava sediminum]OOY22490.1 hypothetical protein BMI91_19605 [Thioclava sediminum]
MKFSELAKDAETLAKHLPVAAVKLRGHDVDVFRIAAGDILYAVGKAPALLDAWTEEGEGRATKIAEALSSAGLDVIDHLIAAGLKATREEVSQFELDLSEQFNILNAILKHSIPDELLEKVHAGLANAGLGFGETASAD